MTDELTIYISPEDDLTNVRERLEHIPTRRVTLVIPAQTQLRSHVAWKVLHARARELGKEVLIISSDPQIRSVAQAAKFRVAHSLESPPTGKSRMGGRPTRNSSGSRGGKLSSAVQRTILGKGSTDLQTPSRTHSSRPLAQPSQWYPNESEYPDSPESKPSRPHETPASGLLDSYSSSFEESDRQFGPSYDFRLDTSPPIRPFSPEQIDEEPDLLLEDFNQAQNIRQAASQGNEAPLLQQVPKEMSPAKESPDYRIAPLPNFSDDSFAYIDDALPQPSTEHHGSVPIEELNTRTYTAQSIIDLPAAAAGSLSGFQGAGGIIEDQGDLGDFVIHPEEQALAHSWTESPPDELQDLTEPPRVYGTRSPRSSSRGGASRGSTQSPRQSIERKDVEPPIEELPTQVTPPARAMGPRLSSPPPRAKSGALNPSPASNSASVPLQLPEGRDRPALARPTPRSGRAPSGSTAGGGYTGAVSRSTRNSFVVPGSSSRNRNLVLSGILLLILFVLGSMIYLIPSANVTITLPARDYTSQVRLTARPGSQTNFDLGIVPAEMLTNNFSADGMGQATGRSKVGTAPATGNVFFSNNGRTGVEIPTETVVATADGNGVLFVTTADAVIPPADGNPPQIPIPIQAQKPGQSGNVPSGSIVLIPDDSLNAIAKLNKVAIADLKLTVTNTSPTTGGGVGNAISVTAKDIDDTKAALRSQVQPDVDAWLKQHVGAGDVMGKPVITDALVNPPAVGQVVDNGSFRLGLKLRITVLVVRHAILQSASIAQLDEALKKDKNYTNYIVIVDTKHGATIAPDQIKVIGDTTSLTLNFPASGKVIPKMPREQIQKWIAGKSVQDAYTTLTTNIPVVQNVEIKTSPGFVNFIPWWTGHINVYFVPGTAPTIPKGQK